MLAALRTFVEVIAFSPPPNSNLISLTTKGAIAAWVRVDCTFVPIVVFCHPSDRKTRDDPFSMPSALETLSRPCVLYAHGNATNSFSSLGIAKKISESLDVNVVIMEYAGYANSLADVDFDEAADRDPQNISTDNETPQPTEFLLRKSAEAALEWLETRVSHTKIILYGFSLGSVAAVHLAALMCDRDMPPRSLILESPIASAMSAVGMHNMRLVDTFCNKKLIQKVDIRIFIMCGSNDRVVDHHNSILLAACAKTDVQMLVVHAAGHSLWPLCDTLIEEFLISAVL